MATNNFTETIQHDQTIENSQNQFTIVTSQKKSESNFLSSVQRYELEWYDLSTIAEDPSLKHLRKVCTNGHLKVSKFRSICWALLLRVLRGNSDEWLKKRRHDRIKYEYIKHKFTLNPHQAVDNKDDPLSQSMQSVWNQHFCDKELMAVIRQDVVRTFPGVEFFRQPRIQDMMIMILFCFARDFPILCYRQGMHEILAPILFVLHCDHQALLHIQELTTPNKILSEILDPKFMEEDAFFIFSKIMSAIEPYYRLHDIVPSASGLFPNALAVSPDESNKTELKVVEQLNFIRDKILAKEDLHLHNHLLKLDIPLPIFGIRWLRLLFGREFPLQDLLILWDAIFADGNSFELTNFIVVSMLIRIKDRLLISDYTTCLTYLMKYPGNADISLIIRHAMHMKSPHLYERPTDAFVYINTSRISLEQQPYTKASTLPRNPQGKAIKNVKTNRSHTSSHDEARVKLTSLTQNADSLRQYKSEKIQANISDIQTKTALATIKLATNTNVDLQQTPGIQDGYMENSCEVLKIQLQNSQTIMSISRLKLNQYLAILKKYIPNSSPDEVHQALDGIEELCALLKTKFSAPYPVPVPVDRAIEANEAADNSQKKLQTKPITVPQPLENTSVTFFTQSPRKQNITEQEVKTRFVQRLNGNDTTYELLANEDPTIDIKPINKNVNQYSSSDSDSEKLDVRRTRYEIPDDQIGRIAAKILGERKELEMHEFMLRDKSDEDRDYLHVPIVDPSGERESLSE